MSAEDIERQQSTGGPTPAMRPVRSYGPRAIPPDIQRQLNAPGNRLTHTDVQAGAPAPFQENVPVVHIGTEPVYSTLPANAGNFNYTQEMSVDSSADPGVAVNALVFSQVVPRGRILYLRDVRVNVLGSFYENEDLELIAEGIPPGTFEYTVFSDSGAEVYNQNIRVEPLDNYNPVSLIAAPGTTVTIRVSFDYSSLPFPPTQVDFIVHVRGDLLVPNDMPVPYTALSRGED